MNRCPKHPKATSCVKDSRPSALYDGTIRRRRKCDKCDFRFSTWEIVETNLAQKESKKKTNDKIAGLLAQIARLL